MTGYDADVVVVGFGGAGAAAALSAAEHGVEVLVVDRDTRGGNTALSGGSLRLRPDVERAARYLSTLSLDRKAAAVHRSMLDGCRDLGGWLVRLGAEIEEMNDAFVTNTLPRVLASPYPTIAGSEALGPRFRVRGRDGQSGGDAVWELLRDAVLRHPRITVRTPAVAVELVRAGQGRVDGVRLREADGVHGVRARHGVVLACGGFEYDRRLQQNYLGFSLPAFGWPGGNDGSGVRLAQGVGAALWHMTSIASVLGYQLPGLEAAVRHSMPDLGYVYVDQECARFVDETGVDFHAIPMDLLRMNPRTFRRDRMPSFLVFDEATRAAGPIADTYLTPYRDEFRWSRDNRAEIERGWIAAADTPRELASTLGLDPDALAATVERYNAGAAAGADPLGRAAADMRPLRGPFYGVALWPCLINTQGGPRRDATCRILDPGGEPIPGLYGAGELGSMWTQLYPGAGNLTEAIVTGRTAGAAAAAALAPPAGPAPATGTVTPAVTDALAAFVADLRAGDLPETALRAARRCVLDQLGCAVFGSTLPWSALVRDYVRDEGSAPRALVWGSGLRASATLAALANATAGHAFEIDDLHAGACFHPGAVTLPAATAVAETFGPLSGADWLAAVVAGYEVGARVGLALGIDHFLAGHHPQGTVGVFAAAATAARALGLDAAATADAFGIAASMSAGLMAAQEGGMVKRLHSGHAAASGVQAALLARRGFTGIKSVLEVPFGGFLSTMGGDQAKLRASVAGLGSTWEIEQVGFKAYASCATNHTSIEAVELLLARHGLAAADVARVEVHVTSDAAIHGGYEYLGREVIEAQMSLRFAVALLLTYGTVEAAHFRDGVIAREDLVALAKSVDVVGDPGIDALGEARRFTAWARIETVDGRAFRQEVDDRKGDPSRPLSDADLERKFRDLLAAAGSPHADRILRLVGDLPRLDDIAELAVLLGGEGA
ncbi:MmgE/PrpD family protein [Phytohabitans suffuscus]